MLYSVVTFLDDQLSIKYHFRSKRLEDCWDFIRSRNNSSDYLYVLDSTERLIEFPSDIQALRKNVFRHNKNEITKYI